ncbi:unnamed protein product [Calicophoron daubneyi]|uniref:Sacsin/Nov domain-containing protein n=1 Tax=Calicophoron daubneyi TaxID=300641 RepID=A0AAV2T168_CALDB
MPFPEPIPSQLDPLMLVTQNTQFHSINDINQAVQVIIWQLSQEKCYTGPGRIQEELFRRYPGAFTFLRSVVVNPDSIPQLVEHRRCIQRANTQLWAYATTHSVITLADMEQLLQLELPGQYQLLGPIVTLPAALEICQTTHFNDRVHDCFAANHNPSSLRVTNEQLLNEMSKCVCANRFRQPCVVSTRSTTDWWASTFTHHMLLKLGDPATPRELKRDDNYPLVLLAPYGIRINGFSSLIQSIVSMLRPENLTKASRLAQNCLETDVRKMYEQFANEFFTQRIETDLREQKPVKALKHLAECASTLHEALKKWADDRGMAWPQGHLDSLLLFGNFVKQVAVGGPFQSLLHLVLCLSTRKRVNVNDLIGDIVQSAKPSQVCVDLTDSPSSPVQTANESPEEDSLLSEESLTEMVEQFKEILKKASNEDKSKHGGAFVDEPFWQTLASFESDWIKSGSKKGNNQCTLLCMLAEAAEKQIVGLPQYVILLQALYQTTPESSSTGKATERITPSSPTEEKKVAVPSPPSTCDPTAICRFVQKLSSVRRRSKKNICELLCRELHIRPSDQLDQMVGSVLADDSNFEVHGPVLYYENVEDVALCASTPSAPVPSIDWSTDTSFLFTQRESVLRLLATCPSLTDLEFWTQWHLPGMLFERWGELENFLDECGPEKVCGEYNLRAIRLLNTGVLLKITACPKSENVELAFIEWADDRSHLSLLKLCDPLVGAALELSNFTPTTSWTVLGSQISGRSGIWIELIGDILLYLPSSFLGLLFSKIIVPCLDKAGLRSASSWATDVSDVDGQSLLSHIFSSDAFFTAPEKRQHLISAVGTLGLQLAWPAFIRFFESHRLNRCKDVTILPARLTPPEASFTKGVDLETSAEDSPAQQDRCVSPDVVTPKHAIQPLPEQNASDRETFISDLRRREFGCGAELDPEAVSLVRRMESKLSRSLVTLSEDLYGLPGHFLLELIQNADDNDYTLPTGSTAHPEPTLEVCAVSRPKVPNELAKEQPELALVVMNNEAVGFTEADISSLCDVGLSTKTDNRNLKTGRKGIGFKSVFNVSDAPEVHSNGFHVRFHRSAQTISSASDSQHSLLLVPEWCGPTKTDPKPSLCWPLPLSLPPWCKTSFVLPVTSKIGACSLQLSSAVQLARETLAPNVMLFLRRLRCLTLSCASPSAPNTECRRTKLLSLHRTSYPLTSENALDLSSSAEVITVSVTERTLDKEGTSALSSTAEHRWFCFKECIKVDHKKLSKPLPKETEIALAFSLTDPEPLPTCPVFAYLPVRGAGFRFFINADFDVTSSREDVDCNSTWNQWLVGQIPHVFAHMIKYVLQFPEDKLEPLLHRTLTSGRLFLLTRILAALPSHAPDSIPDVHTYSGLFMSLPSQIRLRLANLAWLPADQKASGESQTSTYVTAGQLILSAPDSGTSTTLERYRTRTDSVSMSDQIHQLARLLVDRLGMYEPHPYLLSGDQILVESAETKDDSASSEGVKEPNLLLWQRQCATFRRRRDTLLWLGVQKISVDSLLELASKLSREELCRPGLLSALLYCLQSSFTSQLSSGSEDGTHPNSTDMLHRRVLTALRHLPIFHLTTGEIVRIGDAYVHPYKSSFQPQMLIPPLECQIRDQIDIPYDEYIKIVGSLGPLLNPESIANGYDKLDLGCSTLPTLLISEPPAGLGLHVAYPEVVLTDWILPCLEDDTESSTVRECPSEGMLKWLVLVGHFYVSSNRIDNQELPTKLPIIGSDRKHRDRILPGLYKLSGLRRDLPVFLPPSNFTIAPNTVKGTFDELETKLFHFFLDQLDDDDPIMLVSLRYFHDIKSNPRQGYRWFQFFSAAGACTLLSVHPSKFAVSNSALVNDSLSVGLGDDPCLLPLPVGHRLRANLIKSLTDEGLSKDLLQHEPRRTWIIEDFVSPGIELLLSWIGRLPDSGATTEVAYQLACLLHDNWGAFERVEQAWFVEKTDTKGNNGETPQLPDAISSLISVGTATGMKARRLGPARWLQQLRQSRWLPVRLTDSTASVIRLVPPIGDTVIYSPSAFSEVRAKEADLANLLQRACHTWDLGTLIVRDPPNPNFTRAIGLICELDCSAFEYVMKFLSTAATECRPLPKELSPDLMLKLYRAALQCSTRKSASMNVEGCGWKWMRSVFANPDQPCVLVRCISTIHEEPEPAKRPRVDSPNNVGNTGELEPAFCPVCKSTRPSNEDKALVSVTSRKRFSDRPQESNQEVKETEAVYHLVQPDSVCWNRAGLPTGGLTSSSHTSEEAEDEEFVEFHSDQCCVFSTPTQASHTDRILWAKTVTKPRVFALTDCYGSECRQFFVDRLRIASTSSLGELLSICPEAPLPSAPGVGISDKQWLMFGRRLGQWYALLDHCLLEEGVLQNTLSDGHKTRRHRKNSIQESDITQGNKSADGLLNCLMQFPLLFGSDCQWYRPVDIIRLNKKGQTSEGKTVVSRSETSLFGWSRPSFASMLQGQLLTNSTGHRILAHSLDLLNARHSSSTTSTSASPDQTFCTPSDVFSDSSSSIIHCEGTAHGLLLDVIGLPVIDRIGALNMEGYLGSTPGRSNPQSCAMIPCAQLNTFFNVFLRIVGLWKSTLGGTRSATMPQIEDVIGSVKCCAFLVDRLQLTLSVNIPSSNPASSVLNALRITRRFLACVIKNKLYVDSTLGADLFARLSSLPKAAVAPIVYVCVGLLDDPALENLIQLNRETSLFSQLADFVCPHGGEIKVTLTHFIQGFLNLAKSLAPDISVKLGLGASFSPSAIHQLENYFVSHGIRKTQAKHVLQQICALPESPAREQLIETRETETSSSRSQTSLCSASSDELATGSTAELLQPPREGSTLLGKTTVEGSLGQVESATGTTYKPGSTTRSDTVLGSFTMHTPFVRFTRASDHTSAVSATISNLWAGSSAFPSDLSNRLRRMLGKAATNSAITCSQVGRLGEFYVYHRLMDLIRRNQERQSNFDQLSGVDFPTGHPALGFGRVVRCHWCNADTESHRPFDLEIDVQVECEGSRWTSLLNSLSDEISQNVVRIAQKPSYQQEDHSRPGLLSVGPIFIEVKSTAGNSATNTSDSSPDMFEISVPEITYASRYGWRYHLLRVVWERKEAGSPIPSLSVAPKIIHIPDLATELCEQSASLRLCIAMLKST